ncbi:MAG: RNA polymerase sigma factor [Deltaproteobacteria bacterium]|nr:RNA polymerase sigma factor [Deltaproteobacteria bacterium]
MRYNDDMDECDAFYRAHKNKLFSYLMRLTGEYHLSCDIMQESFIRYCQRYKEEKNLSLLYRIAKNAFLDSIRKRKRDTLLDESQSDHSNSQEHTIMVREEYRRVIEAMQKLNEDERNTLSLALNGDLSYREIGELTGTSEGNVKVKVHRARVRLKTFLREEGV